MMWAMTPKQIRFIQEFMIDQNGTQAAIRAGYAESGASEEAYRLLSNAQIATALTEMQANRAAVVGIDAAWVLKRAGLLANFNIEKFITVKGGAAYYDFRAATTDDWYCISEYTVKTVRGHVGLIPIDEVKIKAYDKARMLELVGKHVNVQAFKDRVEHTGEITTKVEHVIVDPKNTSS